MKAKVFTSGVVWKKGGGSRQAGKFSFLARELELPTEVKGKGLAREEEEEEEEDDEAVTLVMGEVMEKEACAWISGWKMRTQAPVWK